MIKIVTKDKKLTEKLNEELKIPKVKQYEYVLTNDQKFTEADKVTIIFNENKIEEMKKLTRFIMQGEDVYIIVENSLGKKRINVNIIEYFEALENDVFAVVGKQRYYVLEKLYVLEELLLEKNFIRTSKSFLVNILQIVYIKPLFNYKLELVMKNGDRIDVNRTYMKSFKESLKI